MNDLQAQLEEVSKEKQELQEKVRMHPGTMGGTTDLLPTPCGTALHHGGAEQSSGKLSIRMGAAWPAALPPGQRGSGGRVIVVEAEAVPSPQLQGLQSQLEFLEQSMVDKSLVSRQEAKIRELETRLEFERTQVKRLEVVTGLSLCSSWDRGAAGP